MTPSDLTAALRVAARASRLLVASDYDGCLSPIIADPAQAIPHPGALEAFLSVAARNTVHAAIVSGRSPEVLERFVGAHEQIELVGNHGSTLDTDDDPHRRVTALTADLSAAAVMHPGAVVEPKSLGAAFHYRHVTDERSAIESASGVGAAHGARTITGKKVLEFVFGDGDKGTAIAALVRQWNTDCTVFFGDDLTDEAVFAVLGPHDVGIKVGEGDTMATYRVADPNGVAEALGELDAALGS